MSAPSKVIPLSYSLNAVAAALIQFKGSEKGPATFEAVAPMLSNMVASGGSKVELSATTATHAVMKALHAETLKTPVAKAFRQVCLSALEQFKVSGRAKDQAGHDARMLELSAVWCTFFRDATPKAKSDKETTAQALARVSAELAGVRIERDALAVERDALATACNSLQGQVNALLSSADKLVTALSE